METATAEKTSLQIRRVYNVPVAKVYAAWTDPEQIKQWMGPSDDYGETEVTSEFRVGGRYKLVMHAPSGEVHTVVGAYREIVPNKKVVYTWAWHTTPDRESLVTVEFKPSGNGTELVLTHEQFADSDARDRHQQGWNGCIERFGRYLAR
jgi:uncharacterized protein YndB with AHSA1/START domain